MAYFSDQILLLILWLVKSLRHHIEEKLKLITLDLDVGSEHSVNKLLLCDVAVAELV